MRRFFLTAAFCMAGVAASAATTVIDFEGYSVGTDLTGVDLGGVTLTKGGETIVVRSDVPGGASTRSIASSPFGGVEAYRADFTSTITGFSIDMGDFGPSDSDTLTVKAFSALDVLLDSVSLDYGTGPTRLETLSVAAAGISYVLFNGGSPTFPSSIFADNLSYTSTVSAVPLPAGGLLLIGALGGLGFIRRRKSKS